MCRAKALPCDDWIIAIIAEGRGLLRGWVLPVLFAQRGNSHGQNLPWNQHTKEAMKATRPEQVVIAPFCWNAPPVWKGARLVVRGFQFDSKHGLPEVFLPSWTESMGQLQASTRKTHVQHGHCSAAQGWSWVEKVNSQINETAGGVPSTIWRLQQHSSPLFSTKTHRLSSFLSGAGKWNKHLTSTTGWCHFLLLPANAALASAVIKAHQYSAWPTN